MKKRILAFLMAVVMMVGLLPMSALATVANEPTVYLSISDDATYASGKNGEAMAYVPVKLSDLETIKLEDYDLGRFAQDADSDGQEDITVLHLYLYAHKAYYADGAEGQLTAEGSPGSLFMTKFWGHDCNLTYYVNGEYPAMDGWGITADQLVLSDGDFVDVSMYTSWEFYSDPAMGFHYFQEGDRITHSYTAEAGQALTVSLGRAGGMGYTTLSHESGYAVYYGTALYAGDAKTVTTNSEGKAEITFPDAGTWYLWADGGKGDYTDAIVSSPAYAKVTVTAPACEHTWKDATCTDPKTCANCGETEGEANPEAHSYKDGKCEYCEQAEPVSYPFTLTVGGEELTITDLGTTVECTKMYYTAKQMKVTVPAGTTTVVVNGVSGAVTIFPNHGSQKNASPGSNTEVSVATGTYLCMRDIIGGGWYHVAIEFAPCETHDWRDATCTTPKTCANCGETEGEADPDAHSYVDGTCEHCGEAEPAATPSYTIKLSEAEELTAGLNYFISVPAEVLGKDIIFDFGSGTIKGAMCQRHCSKRDIWTAGEGSTMLITADKVAAHLCNESQRAKVASDFNLYLTEGSQMFAFYWWTSANMNGSYIYIEILPAEEECAHETWNPATCTTPKTCANCGETEGEADPDAHSYKDGTCEYCGAAKVEAVPFSQTIETPSNGSKVWGYVSSLELSGTDGSVKEYRWASESDPFVLNVVLGEDTDLDATITAKFAITYADDRYVPTLSGEDTVRLENGKGSITVTAVSGKPKSYPDTTWTVKLTVFDPNQTYDVTLPTNNVGFSVRATSSPTVTSGGEFSFKLNIYDDYKKGENFKVLANGVELTSSGDTYTITNITANQTVTVEGVVEKTLAEKNVTVNAPAGSIVSSGAFHSYFKYDFVEPLQISTLEDGRVQYIVPATSGAGGFIRVQNPNGVTYWDFGDLAIGKVFNITEEMLFIGNTEYTKDTVFANYEKNGHDTASLYLTVNAQGWLDMDTGDTHSLNVFRNWIPVSNSTTNTGVSLPDVSYTVVDVNGNPSDVVTVTPDANNSCYADITATKSGTAIILVTYDAVYNADGEGGKQFSAIWPENTGVIVVTVDAEDADIQTNITVNEEANAGGKQILDVEHDILFYVGNAGAEYSFKPEDDCTVTISRSTVGNEMTFNGFTNEGVTVSEDGTVTLSGLTTGAHIVKVEKDGKAAYQVIRAREVSYKLTHSDDTEVTAENPAQPGETITVQFSKLIDPMGKLSGVYNANYGFRYTGENGEDISIKSTSAYGEYYFGSNPARQRLSLTVPADWSGSTYTFTDGGLVLGGWGSTFGGHRSTSYMEGKEPNLNASGTAGVAAVLPDVVIPVYVETYTVTLPAETTGYTVTAADGSSSPVIKGEDYSFTVTVAEGYVADEDFAVKANGTALTAVDGVYTIENVAAHQTVTVEGVKKTYTVTLPTGEGYTVTAARDSISPVTEGGSYSFIVKVSEGYDDSKMEVKVNDASIAHVDGIYTISNITADQVVTVTGVEKIPEPALTWQQVMAKTQAYLTAQAEATDPIVGSTSGEWLVLGLARAGVSAEEDFFQGYYENVLEEEIDANGRLDANRSTENSRVILALTALGKDVTNVGGHDLLQGLSDQDFVKKQGINGPVWALIALDSHGYDIPANADSSKQVTREWLINHILEKQLEGGGWNIQGQAPDDMTPMAVQALAPYYNTNSQVKSLNNSLNNSQVNAAVDKALTIMDEMVETTTSPETLSQIIVARSALGLDSEAAVAKLAALAQEDGSFKKGPSDSKANQMSTEQAFYALVAYDRFQFGKTALYDMSDVEINKVEGDTPQEPIPVTGITLNKSTLTLEVGKTSTLTAAVTPNNATDKTVTWTSSNSGVATVTAQGRVTAVAEGTARIAAKAGDVTASCVVTVTAQEVPLDFGLTESQIKGYVTVSFEDFGKRVAGESMDTIYTKALGTIIPATQVPYKTGDTIASVTIRLLDAMDYTSSYQGSVTSGFYLESIGNFTHNGTYYRSFGEFDAGVGSGWMITWNNWFIDKGASEFNVKNGDVIEWQYTCQLGADIGKDVSGDLTAVQAVEDLINAIGTVTKDSGKAIEAARAAYDALTADQKKLVENYSKLTAAEKTYAALLETDHPFTDAIGHWAEDAITFVYEKGLMTGTKADQFSPNTELSRAMLVTILYRMEGEPAVTGSNTFSDVKGDTWYTDAVIWASANGIVNGVGKDRFAPDQDITREQIATMFLRYSDYKGYDTAQRNDLTGYTDADSISSWALEALQWANGEGLITGRKADLLAPLGDTTRAETATILMRYLETIA